MVKIKYIIICIVLSSCNNICDNITETGYINNTSSDIKMKMYISYDSIQQIDSLIIYQDNSIIVSPQYGSTAYFDFVDSVIVLYDTKQKIYYKNENCAAVIHSLYCENSYNAQLLKCDGVRYTYTFTEADYAAADSIP